MDQDSIVSIALLAEMSLAAYQDEPRIMPSGWEAAATFRTDYAFSVLFRHPGSNQFVLANRGTDHWLSWRGPTGQALNNGGMMVSDRMPDAVRNAMHFGLQETALRHAHQTMLQAAALVGPREFYVTGHSQGGAHAILQAAARRLPGVVFNPMTPKLTTDVWDRTDPTRFITVRHREDIAGMATRGTVGRLIEVGPQDTWPKLTPGQETIVEHLFPPAVGEAYLIYKYARLMWVSIPAHFMGCLAKRLAADAVFHADLGWLSSDGDRL